MPPGEPPVHKGKIMDYLLDIVRTLLLSVAALVVCFLLALAGFILIYGDKGREERSLPPRSRRQLLKLLVCTLIPRLFAVLVLRRPLMEDEARHMRRHQADRAGAPSPDAPEGSEEPEDSEAAGPLPERETLPEASLRPVSGAGRYEEWLRQRRRRRDKKA